MDEPRTLDSVTSEELTALGFADPTRAQRLLFSLAGQGVTDDILEQLLPSLLLALAGSPDPDRALNNFERWSRAVTSRYTQFQFLLRHPAALKILLTICGVSQYFADILIRNPEYFEIIADPNLRGSEQDVRQAATLYRNLSRFVDFISNPDLKLEAMRRFKQRELLRIGARDILGLSDMPQTAREFSDLADTCVQKCYEIGVGVLRQKYGEDAAFPFCVIGMGKLGGSELNYSSDIDLMFVCGDMEESESGSSSERSKRAMTFALKLSEFIVNSLSRNMQNGHLFRVDMRLRPEGRFGPLARTLSSYRSYYENWAEPWERQSLLKARPIAGDARLGEAFQKLVSGYVYPRSVTTDFVKAIRINKERIEKKAELENRTLTDVKIGFGGIRDIEFIAQILQLELGGRFPLLRTPNTLDALSRLRQAGVLTTQEASELTEDYIFLRNVEHRLQILYDRQTQAIPTDPEERRLLARRMGYRDRERFDLDYRRRTHRVRSHFESLFYGARLDKSGAEADNWRSLLMNVETPEAREIILNRLSSSGFQDSIRAYQFLKHYAYGGDYGLEDPEAREQFRSFGGHLIEACRITGDPDSALIGMEHFIHSSPNHSQVYLALTENEELLERLCRLAAGSLPLMQSLSRHPEWLDLLVSEEAMEPATKSREQAIAELKIRLKSVSSEKSFWDSLALYIQRERLRIGARDIWGIATPLMTVHELSALADAAIYAILNYAKQSRMEDSLSEAARSALESVAIIGLGKLGGRETGYGSDWDILIVYGDSEENETAQERYSAVNALAEFLLTASQELRTRNAPVELDARLRPEGRFGALARTVSEYLKYYSRQSLVWERQVLIKARYVAGCSETAKLYLRGIHRILYAEPLSVEERDEIVAMKRRIEKERLKWEERLTDVKLGHGGMSDIEFATQLCQLQTGAAYPQTRTTETVEALYSLSEAGAIPKPDAARLVETYSFWTSIRNRLTLLGGLANDVLPSDPRRLRALAIGFGAADMPEESAESLFQRRFTERMSETRAIVARLFYGEL
jgi:glutamate-ammonia-ligase adenylyltransferase